MDPGRDERGGERGLDNSESARREAETTCTDPDAPGQDQGRPGDGASDSHDGYGQTGDVGHPVHDRQKEDEGPTASPEMQARDTRDCGVDQISGVALGSVDHALGQPVTVRPDRLQPSSEPGVTNSDNASKDRYDNGQNPQDSNEGREIVGIMKVSKLSSATCIHISESVR